MNETKIIELKSNVKDYLELQLRILKLELIDKLSASGSSLASIVIISLIASISLLFLSIGLGFYLSAVLGNICYGFLAVGAIYIILTLFLMGLRKKLLVSPFKNKIVRALRNTEEEEL